MNKPVLCPNCGHPATETKKNTIWCEVCGWMHITRGKVVFLVEE